jgi:hypothetical protein
MTPSKRQMHLGVFWLGTWRYESAATSNNTWPLVAERKPPNGESSISGRRIGMFGDLIPERCSKQSGRGARAPGHYASS